MAQYKSEHQYIENIDEKNVHGVEITSIESENDYLRDADASKIIRKMDWKILPVMSVLYLMSFLDRTNIGNAKVAGLVKELHITDKEYLLTLTMFFFPYALVEVPSNLVLKKVGAKIWLPTIMVLWGVVCLGMGFVDGFKGLLTARIFLGLAEGGLFPGITWYLTTWYPRSKMSLRIAVFFSAATIAGAFGGLLAYGLQHLNKKRHLAGWQWIFIVEGALTVAVAIGAYFFIPNIPSQAHWLTPEEQKIMKYKIEHDGATAVPFDDSFQWKYVRRAFGEWKLHLNLLQYLGSLVPLYSVSLSLPSIVKGMGYETVDQAQLHTIPVYIVACAVVLAASFIADKTGKRAPVILATSMIAMIGWLIMYFSNHVHIRYGGAFLAAAGAYSSFPPVVAMLTGNIAGKTKRACVIGLQVGIGGLAGTVSSNIFRAKDAPHYKFGIKIDLFFTAMCILATLAHMSLLMYFNKRKAAEIASGQAARYSKQELAEMDDRSSPYFTYTW